MAQLYINFAEVDPQLSPALFGEHCEVMHKDFASYLILCPDGDAPNNEWVNECWTNVYWTIVGIGLGFQYAVLGPATIGYKLIVAGEGDHRLAEACPEWAKSFLEKGSLVDWKEIVE